METVSKFNEQVCTILLVDDDEMLLLTYGKILTSEGYKVTVFRKREEAIAWLEQHEAPRVIFLDCRMDGMSNEEFLQRVKSVQHGKVQSKIYGFSAFTEESSYGQEMKKLFGNFIEKPNDLFRFLNSVEKACADTMSGN